MVTTVKMKEVENVEISIAMAAAMMSFAKIKTMAEISCGSCALATNCATSWLYAFSMSGFRAAFGYSDWMNWRPTCSCHARTAANAMLMSETERASSSTTPKNFPSRNYSTRRTGLARMV